VSERRANRRIRLSSASSSSSSRATLARAVWLQGVQAGRSRRWRDASTARRSRSPAGRGHDLRPHRRAARDRRAGDDRLRRPAPIVEPARVALRRARRSDSTRDDSIRARDRTKGFVYVERKADPSRRELREARTSPGLGFYAEEQRYYPQGSVAAHVLGYAAIDNDGLDGLERSLDRRSRQPGSETSSRIPSGGRSTSSSTEPSGPARRPLTIDHQIQANAEAVLARHVQQWRREGGAAIVLDPRTGAVLAMAVAPRFDANRFGASADRASQPRRHRHVRAGLDVQARDDRRRALGGLVTPRRRSRWRRRSRSPTASSTSTTRARPSV
jgi:cell division protein FtsI (penicillin-binding protein 3)